MQIKLTDTQKWQLLAMMVILGGVFYLLAPVLTPFAVSALLAYLFDPLVNALERLKLSRVWAVSIVFAAISVLILILVLILIPALENQVTNLVHNLPKYAAWFRTVAMPWVEQRTGLSLVEFDPQRVIEILQSHWKAAGGIATTILSTVSKSGLMLLAWLANLLLIPVLTFYMLRDWDMMIGRVHELLPRPVEPVISRLARESDQVLGGFLRGQLSVMIALGVVYSLGLWLVGIDLAFLIGMTAGLISFVPYLGGIVGVAAAIIAALVQYHDVTHVLLVLGVFGIGQTLEGMVLTPTLVGDRIGLHPVAVIFAVLAGGQLFGFLGVLLALPVASIVMVVLRYVHTEYVASHLYGAADKSHGDVISEASFANGAAHRDSPLAASINEPMPLAEAATQASNPPEPTAAGSGSTTSTLDKPVA